MKSRSLNSLPDRPFDRPIKHGRVIFVRHALPGEQVLVEITEDRGGSYCRGDAVSIRTASADRVAAPCEYARPGGCGGDRRSRLNRRRGSDSTSPQPLRPILALDLAQAARSCLRFVTYLLPKTVTVRRVVAEDRPSRS